MRGRLLPRVHSSGGKDFCRKRAGPTANVRPEPEQADFAGHRSHIRAQTLQLCGQCYNQPGPVLTATTL